MVHCPDCKKEMLSPSGATGCNHPYVTIKGKSYKRDTIQFDYNRVCHDCGIINIRGNLHHFGCDVEACPKCGGQLISCDCGNKTPTRVRKGKYSSVRYMDEGLPPRFLR
jgi:hypothetical protein